MGAIDLLDIYVAKRKIFPPVLNLSFFFLASIYFMGQYSKTHDAPTLACIITSIFAGSVSFFPIVQLFKSAELIIENDMITVFGTPIMKSSLILIAVANSKAEIYYKDKKDRERKVKINLSMFEVQDGSKLADVLTKYMKTDSV